MKIQELVKWGKEQLKKEEDGALKAKLLLAFLLKTSKEYIIIHSLEELPEEIEKEYQEDIQKLKNGVPLQYITKEQEFMKLKFYVEEGVLIPQPDTEILVEEVLKLAKQKEGKIQILDLCTGSGAIGISLAKYLPNSEVILSDISKKALNIAKENAKRHLERTIEVRESDFFEKIIEKFDIIVSNPPYIKTKIIPTLNREVQKEPQIALDGGIDGLEAYRKILKKAGEHLKENGILALEIGYDQKEEVVTLLQETREYVPIETKQDLAGNDRVIIAKKGEN